MRYHELSAMSYHFINGSYYAACTCLPFQSAYLSDGYLSILNELKLYLLDVYATDILNIIFVRVMWPLSAHYSVELDG